MDVSTGHSGTPQKFIFGNISIINKAWQKSPRGFGLKDSLHQTTYQATNCSSLEKTRHRRVLIHERSNNLFLAYLAYLAINMQFILDTNGIR